MNYALKKIVGYTHYLVMKAQHAGNLIFDGHKATIDEENVALKLRELSNMIGSRLSVCRESEIADLLECYDLAFRIGHNRVPDDSMLNRHSHRLFRAWESNGKSVEESAVIRVISAYFKRAKGNADKDLAETFNSILKKWITDLMLHSSFPDATTYEAYQRLALLMPLDLHHYLGESARDLKRKWFKAYKVEDLSLLDTHKLCSYRRFLCSLPPEVLKFEKQKEFERNALIELTGRKDLDPYDREAFRMSLNYTEELMRP